VRWEGFGPEGHRWSITIRLVRSPSPRSRGLGLTRAVQADGLLIVEQIQDYKDARYAPTCKNTVILTVGFTKLEAMPIATYSFCR